MIGYQGKQVLNEKELKCNTTEWKKADSRKRGTTWPELNPASVAPTGKSTATCSFSST